jgi:hypothetical protein
LYTKSYPYVGPPEDSVKPDAIVTYSFEKRVSRYEEGCFRGTFCFSTSQTYTPVNARPREIGCRAFRILGVFFAGAYADFSGRSASAECDEIRNHTRSRGRVGRPLSHTAAALPIARCQPETGRPIARAAARRSVRLVGSLPGIHADTPRGQRARERHGIPRSHGGVPLQH